MDQVIHVAVTILFGWIALSLVLVFAWSRFMTHVRRKELELPMASVGTAVLQPYRSAA